MLKQISNLKGAKALEVTSQKKINGGNPYFDQCGCSGRENSPCMCNGNPGWCIYDLCAY